MSFLSSSALEQLFISARSSFVWKKTEVSDQTLHQLYDLLKFPPTSANGAPGRFVFVKSVAAKRKLLEAVSEGNREKTETAPVTAIIAYDLKFYEKLGKLFPHEDAASWFRGNQALIDETAFRNGSLQGAYLIMAARALGLDCGPMSGFDKGKVDESFFSGTSIKSNFLCNLGYADNASIFPRLPRLNFDECCQIL